MKGKITQVRVRKGKLEKVCWVKASNTLKEKSLVRMPDKSIWIVEEVYATKDSNSVHDAHEYRPEV